MPPNERRRPSRKGGAGVQTAGDAEGQPQDTAPQGAPFQVMPPYRFDGLDLTDDQRSYLSLIASMRAMGGSIRVIASTVGMSKSQLHRWLQVMRQHEDFEPRPSVEWVLERRAQGASYREIAGAAGVSHQTIMRMVQTSHTGHVDQCATGNGEQPHGPDVPHGTRGPGAAS